MKRFHEVALLPLLVLAIIVPLALAGCSSPTATTTTTTTTATSPGGPGGGLVVRNDSVNTVRILSTSPRGNGVTDLSVTLVSTQNVSDLVNPVADKVGQNISVWTDEDVSAYKVGDSVTGHIEYAGDTVIGLTLHLFNIAKQ